VRALVVLPTFNEAENIDDVLTRLRAAVPDIAILVVDDNSPDGTGDLAQAYGDVHGGVEVLRRAAKSGLGSAYRAGFRHGIDLGFDALVEMDSDLSHDPAALPSLLAALDEPAVGLVVGSRYVPGGSIPQWTLHRRLLSEWGNRYAAAVLGMKVRDSTSGYRAYRAKAVAQLDLDQIRADGYGFQIEMAYEIGRLGWQVDEVPISFTDRVRGESKMSSHIVTEALKLVTWWGVRDRVLRRRSPARRAPAVDTAGQ
jgi:dolichol-phosphate mannosyltransferase